jgi:hypothetical protein
VVGPVGEDLDGGEAPHPDPLWMGHLRGKRLRQRVVRERGHGDRDRDRDSRTRRRGRGHDGVGIEKIHGVVLVLQQFVEHLSFISFRRRLDIRREPVKVDEHCDCPYGLALGRRALGTRTQRDRRRAGKGLETAGRAQRCQSPSLQSLASTCADARWWAFRGHKGRRGRRRGRLEERRKPIHDRVAQCERGLRRLRGRRRRRGPEWCWSEDRVRGQRGTTCKEA